MPAGGQPGLEQLGAQFAQLSTLLSGSPDPERLVAFAARAVPHGEHCGLTLTRGSGRPLTLARSGDLVDQVDRIQYATGQGPCLDAVDGDDLVRVDDLGADGPWPEFARRCVAETGVRSMFSVRLVLSGDDRAALNFYAHGPGVMDDLDIGTGALVAPFAAVAVRDLMARRLLTAEQAMAQLVRASQHLNRKLRDIAAEVEQTGELPTVPDRPRRRDRP